MGEKLSELGCCETVRSTESEKLKLVLMKGIDLAAKATTRMTGRASTEISYFVAVLLFICVTRSALEYLKVTSLFGC